MAQRLTDAELVDRIVERMEDAAEHLQSGDYQLEKDVIFEQVCVRAFIKFFSSACLAGRSWYFAGVGSGRRR